MDRIRKVVFEKPNVNGFDYGIRYFPSIIPSSTSTKADFESKVGL